jgi:hypothetical protein
VRASPSFLTIIADCAATCCDVLRRILQHFVDLQAAGGLEFTPSTGPPVRLYPVVTMVCCDNKEAVALASVKAGQTPKPCRHCFRDLDQLNLFQNAQSSAPRDAAAAANAIATGNRDYCTRNSIHGDVQVRRPQLKLCVAWLAVIDLWCVVQNAFLEFHEALGPDQLHRVYDCFPPDLLHTVYGGLLRYTCVWTLELIKVRD